MIPYDLRISEYFVQRPPYPAELTAGVEQENHIYPVIFFSTRGIIVDTVLHFDLSEIIALARYLPVTPAKPVTRETCSLPLD